jgi:16S rRNA (guanine966-N2)-methyltransferase
MRVIAGSWRGRPLAAPSGVATRPTGDRVREALFSMLASRLGGFDDLAVADLFAGSGALGIEALSRGAAHCLFVDSDRAACDIIRANLARLGADPARFDVRQQQAERVSPVRPLDLVLLDPPYGSDLAGRALGHLLHCGGLAPGALASVETARGEALAPPGFGVDTDRTFGKARITLFRRND